MATYDLTTTIPSKIVEGDILNCPYSGTYKSIQLPKGEYKLEVWGAQGGGRSSYIGGKGGYSYGTINLAEKTTFFIYAGGYPGISKSAGFNGGGATSNYGGGGGGASDIRIGTNTTSYRVIVAGGGGGAGYECNGGAGGGINGSYGDGGTDSNGFFIEGGYYGSQTAGGSKHNAGSFGQGGKASSGGGGGGGWYGGGSGTSGSKDSGGGGGSGFIFTVPVNDNSLNSKYCLTNAETINGGYSFIDYSGSTVTGHEGNGACRITALSVAILPTVIWFKNSSNIWQKMN